MSSRAANKPALSDWATAVELYGDVLKLFYESGDAGRAARPALKLLRLLDRLDPKAATMPGNEYRAVIAELDGDLDAAIDYRKRELRLFDRLIRSDQLAAAKLAMADYSDRLDLLALLYLDAGRLTEAQKEIQRSEDFCREHGIPFDGEDVKRDILGERPNRRNGVSRAGPA